MAETMASRAQAIGSAGVGLRTILGEAPLAVLVVDLDSGQVVHANDVATQLAPEAQLPVRLDAWGRSAGLRDPAGVELEDTDHPLSRLLRAEGVPGQPVNAHRRSEIGESREPLWLIGIPMAGAPMLESHALVVLLSVEEAQHAEDGVVAAEAIASQEAQLRQRAVLATGLSFTVADAREPDCPLVWVNPAFTTATGYEFDEAVGRNCRFLQGEGTDRDEIARIRTAIRKREPVVATVLNYRKDGLAFWNQVTITPISDAEGVVTHFVGVQTDVSGRVFADVERDRALLAEQTARAEAEAAQARLSLLAEATQAVADELEEADARGRLLDLIVPDLADSAALFQLDQRGFVTDHMTRHRDSDLAEATERLAAEVRPLTPRGGLVRALLGDDSLRLITDVGSEASREAAREFVTDRSFLQRFETSLEVSSTLIVGLPGRDSIRDVLVLNRTAQRPAFTNDDATLAQELGRRTGLILENLRLYVTQSRIARTLQRSLLPTLPELGWLDVDARYLAGADDAEIGGDFYDVFEYPDGGIGVAVGDVEGHDIYAAAAMGQLKGLLRATALTQRAMPAAILEQVDRLVSQSPTRPSPAPRGDDQGPDRPGAPEPENVARLATLSLAHLEPPRASAIDFSPVRALSAADEPPTDDPEQLERVGLRDSSVSVVRDEMRPGPTWTLTLSSAGHPPPLTRLPNGEVVFLDPPFAQGPLLGLGLTRRRHDATFLLPAGSVVLFYTDGLIERRSDRRDEAEQRLIRAAASAPDGVEAFVDHVLAELVGDRSDRIGDADDDVVVVALCLHEEEAESARA
ncbi:PP2C family protein-serine/threonine phosphatase [Aeromicrobium sp. Leaf350]|uniref:PP2C family protein-serine/threonine phosphatase n=1 Tax=Aeromicrobium sp. Leaf350 TaxID=2876565 RepID=UPI001E6236C3|nr:PP2C family protein-serine/threonine phosphatase [Aeromicrobium sp. Leaf350]